MDNAERNSYVKKQITEALIDFLKSKELSDISISEVTKKARVSRISFYRNFETKEDILKAYINTIFHEWMNETDKKENIPLSETLGLMFSHFDKYRDFYALLSERKLVCLLKDVIVDLCGPKPEHSAVEAYARAYVAYTLYGWVETWFMRGMKESAEEIAGMFKERGL